MDLARCVSYLENVLLLFFTFSDFDAIFSHTITFLLLRTITNLPMVPLSIYRSFGLGYTVCFHLYISTLQTTEINTAQTLKTFSVFRLLGFMGTIFRTMACWESGKAFTLRAAASLNQMTTETSNVLSSSTCQANNRVRGTTIHIQAVLEVPPTTRGSSNNNSLSIVDMDMN